MFPSKMTSLGFYMCILLQLIALTNGTGILEVKLISFANEGWRDTQGSCCGGDSSSTSSCSSACTPYFRICLKQWQNPVSPDGPCSYGSRVTEVFTTADAASTSPVLRFDLARTGIYQEPIKFPFTFSWTGTMSLIVEAWHGSSNGSAQATISAAAAPSSSSNDVQSSPSAPGTKQLLLRIAEPRDLKVGYEWTQETHTNNHSRLDVQYRVVCEQHYYGEDCSHFCRPRDDQYGHYLCTANGSRVCVDGWTGNSCNRAICAAGCHAENGFCTEPGKCECYLGYQGDLCHECVRYPGCVHGTCKKSFECQCDEGWGGLFCNQDLNFCTHHKPCKNGATCTNTGSGHYTCQCRPGYTGVNCEKRIETCAQTPCLNGGTCSESTSNYTCQCPPDYSGRHCQSNARTCEDGPCENGGSCSDAPGGGYRCICTPGYEGSNCDVERDECAQGNPCVNGGTCISRRASAASPVDVLSTPEFYQCSCPTGFTGPRCETNINDCTLQPCLNGGTCRDLIGSFKCECAPGFAGMLCQQNIDDCLKRPCANGGTCFDGVNDFRCMCRPGFRGKDCSIDINECESNPCRNGGTCTDSIDAYQCRCPPCFVGVNCEQRNDDCMANMDAWPNPDYFVPYNASGHPTLFHHGAPPAAAGRTDATSTSDDTHVSKSVLAIGVPVLVVFSIIMIVLIVIVTCLYRKANKRQSTAADHEAAADAARDLEACKRQNEWNERRARQMGNNNNFNPTTYAVKLDNRSVEANNDGANKAAASYSKAKHLDPCSSPLHSPRGTSNCGNGDKNLNSMPPNYYKIVSVDKLDFSNDDERPRCQRVKVERPKSLLAEDESSLGANNNGRCSDSGLCTPISYDGETHSEYPTALESASFDSGLAVGSPVVSEREVNSSPTGTSSMDECHQQAASASPRLHQSSLADIQASNFKLSSPSTTNNGLRSQQQQQQQQQRRQQMYRHQHHHHQNHQRPSPSSSSHNNRSNDSHTFHTTGDTMLGMEERRQPAATSPVSHV